MHRKLTGWLILLIIILGPLQFSGGSTSIRSVADSVRPYLANNPFLPTAIDVCQLLIGASIAVWVYTAWLLFRREQGTLKKILATFVAGAALRIVGIFSIVLLGGLPANSVHGMLQQIIPSAAGGLLMCGTWYLYLIRSERVRELYA